MKIKRIKFYVVDERRLSETAWLADLPFNTPIVFYEIKTGSGKRYGFKKYRTWRDKLLGKDKTE